MALNKAVDLTTAQAITSIDKLLEVIVAPSFDDDALELLRERWKNVRLLAVGPVEGVRSARAAPAQDRRRLLVQERDLLGLDDIDVEGRVERGSRRSRRWTTCRFAWLVCKHVKSNAIAIGEGWDAARRGGGADGPRRRRPARDRQGGRAGEGRRGGVSDAFFPFPDGPQLLLDAGVTAIIHPAGR